MNRLAENIFREALDELTPSVILSELFGEGRIKSEQDDIDIDLDRFENIYVAGSGKASWEMVHTLCEELQDLVTKALAISSFEPDESHPKIEFYEASHPVPDETSIEAGSRLTRFFEEVPPNSLLLYAISGGTSSLVCSPAGEVSIDDLNRTYELLNNSGATIREINTVRKHLSTLKGGQLLRHLDPSVTLLDLVISDVPNDDLQIIGSGPTTPDGSTFQDAYHILLEYRLWQKLPDSVKVHVEQGIDGVAPETIKEGEDTVKNHQAIIVGSASKLAGKAGALLQKEGYNSWIAETAYNKDVGEVAREIAERVISVDQRRSPLPLPAALLFYGESTVEVTGDGKGGRNQELALRGALEIEGYENVTWLSAGTDGIDGPTDAAGAIVDGRTITKARDHGLDPHQYLARNDAYHFHNAIGTLLKTGPTGNNLMDLQIILVD
ncbi:MAG: DUF4147 domain-containing protein [Balneolaceae bacterium]|nr:DUF4147 domain-containing protein [Balneolaceae bacterium]